MATMAEENPAGTKIDAGVVAEPFRQEVSTPDALLRSATFFATLLLKLLCFFETSGIVW